MRLVIHPLNLLGKPDENWGRVLEGGDATALLDALMSPRGFSALSGKDPDGFIEACLANINNFTGLEAAVSGERLEDRAAAFFRVLAELGLATRMD